SIRRYPFVATIPIRDVPSRYKSLISESYKMKIAIAADHAGYEEKEQLKPLLDELGVQYEDLGTASPKSVDYPNYASKVAEEVARSRSKKLRVVQRNKFGVRRQSAAATALWIF